VRATLLRLFNKPLLSANSHNDLFEAISLMYFMDIAGLALKKLTTAILQQCNNF